MRPIAKRSLLLIPLFLTAIVGKSSAAAPQERVNAFYQELNTWCGNGLLFVNADFEKNFAEKDQADVLAEIIERSSKSPDDIYVLLHAMGMTQGFVRPDGSKPWNSRLKAALFAQAQNLNPEARSALVELLIARHEAALKDKILSFLKDDSDEVRQIVINGIVKDGWPEARHVCLEYITRNQSDPNYKGSIVCAKRYTNPTDAARSSKIAQKWDQPDAQEQFEAYINAHKGDPDYEVSVDTAERSLKLIRENLDFAKAAEDEKKRADMLHKLTAEIEAGKPAQDLSFSDQVNFVFWLFNTKDPSTSQYAGRYFFDAIPVNSRAELLTAMADRATQSPVNNDVLKNVVEIAEFQPQMLPKNRIWSARLESLVWDQRSNPDRIIRSYVLRDLAGWGESQHKDQILSFLEDKDPFVRETCISVIFHWPDAKGIFTAFKEKHQSDPAYHSTLFAIQELVGDSHR